MRIGRVLALLLLLFNDGHAQSGSASSLTVASLRSGQSIELDKLPWKYRPGDDLAWAAPQFDDRDWETLNGTAITLDQIPKSGWQGRGWFRLRLKVDPTLSSQPLALVMVHYGASEVYLDGHRIQSFGTVGATPETEDSYNPNTLPIYVVFDERGEHILAVRHSCMELRDLSGGWGRWVARQSFRPVISAFTNRTPNYGAGFGLRVIGAEQARDEQVAKRANGGLYLLNIGLLLAIGLLHLLLFWFYPRLRANLFFGLFACSSAAANVIYYRWSLSHQSATGIIIQLAVNIALTWIGMGMLLAFMYSAFAVRVPGWFWVWVAAAVGYVAITQFIVELTEVRRWYNHALHWFVIVEILRGSYQAIRKKVAGAWIVGAGMLAYTLYITITSLILLRRLSETGSSTAIRNVVTLFLTITISIFLARRFARTSLDLESQLTQVKQLSEKELEYQRTEAELRIQHAQEKAENERRARELDDARRLQLSMLPKRIPQVPHLEIAAYMKPATEVGGDFYDFHVGADGTLTIAIGDATGHGLPAGTMVTAIKSLFVSLADHPDIPQIFERQNRVLKEMKLRGLFMAMTMVKIQGRYMSFSIAGMPPIILYRQATGAVEEVMIKAMPLGGITGYQYKQQELRLSTGDVIVMMSDGLPERFNEQGEMLDYQKVQAELLTVAQLPPEAIIKRLIQVGDEWGGERLQDDDVTFVVVKVR